MSASALIASLKVKLSRRYFSFTQQSVLWMKTDLVVTLIFFVFFQTFSQSSLASLSLLSMYSKMDQIKFVEDSLYKVWKDMVCLSRPHHTKFFKDCISQILLFQFLNILTHKHCKPPTSITAAFSFFKLLATTNARVQLCFSFTPF